MERVNQNKSESVLVLTALLFQISHEVLFGSTDRSICVSGSASDIKECVRYLAAILHEVSSTIYTSGVFIVKFNGTRHVLLDQLASIKCVKCQ